MTMLGYNETKHKSSSVNLSLSACLIGIIEGRSSDINGLLKVKQPLLSIQNGGRDTYQGKYDDLLRYT